jgi:hypothetical protein
MRTSQKVRRANCKRKIAEEWTVSVDEKAKREEHVRAAIASARIEGREPSPFTLALLERYVAGEVTIDEAMKDVLREYGLPAASTGE